MSIYTECTDGFLNMFTIDLHQDSRHMFSYFSRKWHFENPSRPDFKVGEQRPKSKDK